MVQFPVAVEIFVLCEMSRPDLSSTSPPIQWALGSLSAVVKRSGREADYSEIFVSRSRMSGAMPPLPNVPSGRAQGQFYLHLDPMDVVNYWLNRTL